MKIGPELVGRSVQQVTTGAVAWIAEVATESVLLQQLETMEMARLPREAFEAGWLLLPTGLVNGHVDAPAWWNHPAYRQALEDAAANLERHANEKITTREGQRIFLRDEDKRVTLTGLAHGLRCLDSDRAQRILRFYRADPENWQANLSAADAADEARK